MAALVDDELALEEQVEVVGLLVLHHAHLHGLAAVLVVQVLGPQRRRALLVLHGTSVHASQGRNQPT